MRTKQTRAAVPVTLLLLCLPLIVAACGGDAADDALAGTAAERAQKILGAAPTGVAATVVERGSMVVANDADYAPQSSVDRSTGELTGFDVDVAKRVGEILGLEVSFKNPEWETVPAGLKQKRFDVSVGSMPITPEYDEVVDFTRPYSSTPAQLFVAKGGPQIESADDLARKTVGVGLATTFYDFLKQDTGAIVKAYATDSDALSDLSNGTLDFVLTAGPTGQQAILDGQPIEPSGTPLFYEKLGIAVAQGESDWVKLLDYAVAEMHKDGSLSELSKTWYDGLDLTVAD
jgi:polar amino acid transport system substrate-binding protein